MISLSPRSSNGPRASIAWTALLLHIAGNDAGERAPQVGRQHVRIQVAAQLELRHRFMRRLERLLETPAESSAAS